MEILVPVPPGFSFKRTVLSHGWSGLLPFALDEQKWSLRRVLALLGARPVTVIVTEAPGALSVTVSRALGPRAAASVARDIRHVFRLDDAMEEFYAEMRAHPEFAWITQQGAGRLLRSPTVYEDLVKTICTTNCSWALTEKMVTGLVEGLGRETADGRRDFPTAAAMAAAPLGFYTDEVRAGYRAAYLKELAERVAGGELRVEEWLASDLPTAELKREMKRVKGVGDYAAENMLKLLGRYDCLALDSWVRAKFARTRNRGRPATDARIERAYARFRDWRGLALWCDMTRDWIE